VADLELGYRFRDLTLLEQALTHRSLEAEDEEASSNERLEFLGDAVLGLVIADELYASGEHDEGAMAKIRAAVVSESALAGVAEELGLGSHLRMGKGERDSGGSAKPSILSDALEAVIGAIYLDGGFEPARVFIVAQWRALVADRAITPGERDYKTRLQEVLARRGEVPDYAIVGTGPDHDRRFSADVSAGGVALGSGLGSSKKRAEQDAARQALASLEGADA
jgi:ribonuclease III